VAAIKRLPIERLDVVLAGGIRDERLAASIVRAGLPRAGDVHDLDRSIATVVAGLGEPVAVDVAIEVRGATWVYPKTLPAARPGSTLMVYAKMEKPTQAIDVVIGGRTQTIGLGTATPALVERAVAGAEIEELENTLAATTEPTETKALREDIAMRSVRARVISSQTAMLVLETEADYARYKIERTSLADILVVGPKGLEQTRRSAILASKPAPPPPARMALDEGAAGKRDAVRADGHSRVASADATSDDRRAGGRTQAADGAENAPEDGADDTAGSEGASTRMRLAEGAAGSPGSNRADLARAAAIEDARTAGVLDSHQVGFGGNGDVSSGFDDNTVYGELFGNEAGEQSGGFGFGHSGVGPGAGGTGWGSIGTGRYGTIGDDHGTGAGYGVGTGGGVGGMRSRTSAAPSVSIHQPTIQGDGDRAIIRRYIKRNILKIQYCYERLLIAKPGIEGGLAVRFMIRETGVVGAAKAEGVDPEVSTCVADVIAAIHFPRPRGGGAVEVLYPFVFSRRGAPASNAAIPIPGDVGWRRNQPRRVAPPEPAPEPEPEPVVKKGPALTGKLADVMQALRGGNAARALGVARAWHAGAPGDVLALVALGEALEATKDVAAAARIYGSIIDLFSTRADFRRFAGERLERLGGATRELVIDTYRRAVADRPDHVTGHRLLAYALLRHGDHTGAFTTILAGIDREYPNNRFLGAKRVLHEDAGMIAAILIANGGDREHVMLQLTKRSLSLILKPSTRFIMYWETDSNDVDFHIRDSRGGHAYYSRRMLPSGGELYADVTTGYGPECFAIQGTPKAGPYRLSINYYAQGPMGYGMGLLQIQKFDGKAMTFEDRPYVIMRDHAFVDLGSSP
ncbi:MAG: AgmX/PglI C-terminal domain-containing protein, partial [Deltaproteobacteria bacterium]|nr:AgmX/PglI C-terminal domain-containing protein [Deltaproteobacteria bacterium]